MNRTTVLDLRKKKADNSKIVMVTAYDATMARLVEAAGIDMILVGDSLGMVVQGHEDTLPVTLDQIIYHCQCVARGSSKPHLVADLPFMTYQVSPAQALQSAGRVVQEGRAQSVKLEGGVSVAESIQRIVEAGIPVLGHVGLTPQSVHAMGGFRMQGKTQGDAERVLQDALAVQQAGAYAVVLEGIPSDLAARITEQLHVPTIGIGAGVGCDGQVLVSNDLLGMDLSFAPRFVKRYARLQDVAVDALKAYADEVRAGEFPAAEHSFATKREGKVARLY
ncbi:MAG: 3-methyl-2-oxobutanoate hydroxymethyltransferase [Alphaproteobacteria bacterium]|nr:3-methyl-2-oxobutanoate hydroxymethyltransferase [Alphaproteobacteria bacterium]MCB9695590.1 3-methyl-2-oxobutanoate hydroxymethyltransferase [Alphaproteobacteria bacterium]